MTAAVDTEPAALDIPEGTAPVNLPVMVVEGMDTADGRYLEPGSLSVRTFPIPLYSQDKSSHGSLDGDTSTSLVGAILEAVRRPGPEVTQLSTGQPFPEGTFVWQGRGWIYKDVPAPPAKPAYTLIKDGALRGNSVDLSEVEAEFLFAEGQDVATEAPQRIHLNQGVIAATTLVGQPAFPDAYIELDGAAMAMAEPTEALTASAVPMWRSADVGDVCSPCVASAADVPEAFRAEVLADDPDHASLAIEDILAGEDMDAPAPAPRHTGGMVALVPSNPNMLRVPGGDPAEELHLTLAYLGDNVLAWDPELRDAVLDLARKRTDWNYLLAAERQEALEDGRDPKGLTDVLSKQTTHRRPLQATIFSHAVFNPNGDNGHDPATVYLLDGGGDRGEIEMLASDMAYSIQRAIGDVNFPEQHTPYVPHVTAGYNIGTDMLTYTGPVEFDRLRVALGDDVYDFPLGGESGPILASAASLPSADWFANPNLPGPTPPTVEENGRAYGHLACWGTCHISFSGRCVTPPRSASGYAYFMVHSTRALDADGNVVDVPVGYGTLSRSQKQGGHAGMRLSASEAAKHYDNTGTVAFEYAVGEDEYGIWFAGRMLPGLDEEMEHKARGAAFSGDWRNIRGSLELVASLAVNTPGFPVPRVLVAAGSPVALVAGGVPQRPSIPDVADALAAGTVWPSELREILGYVRDQQQAAAEAEASGLLDYLDEVTAEAALAEFCALQADLTLAVEGDHPWFAGGAYADMDAEDGEAFAKKQNWVSKAGGLPKYIKRIVKHLRAKGMAEGQAIATAKNAADKMCKTGDTSLPGDQDVNPGSRAEACAAIADWDRKRKAG